MVKLLSGFFALVVLFGVVTACGNVTNPTETTEAVTTVSLSTTEAPVETEAPLMPLEAKDYGKYEFNVIWPEKHNDGHFMHNEMYAEVNDGDTINTAVFTRNSRVEEAYNIKIKSQLVWCSSVADTATKTVKSGDPATVDAYCAPIAMMTTAALNGYCTDFSKSSYYTTEMPWWDHEVMEGYSIAGKKLFASGDIIYSDNFYPYTIFCNLDKYADYNYSDNVYELVKSGKWTLSKLMELCAVAPNSSDDVWNYEDTYGMLMCNSFAKAMFYASGQNIATIDADKHAVLSISLDKSQALLEDLVRYVHNGHACYDTDDDLGHNIPGKTHAQTAIAMFSANQAVFYAEELITAERLSAAGFNSKFAVLPVPKYTEDQDKYICVMNDAVVISVPTNTDTERAIHILSAMSRESIDTLTPAFYDIVLTYRYMNDPSSVEMLDIILDSVAAADIGCILDWGTIMKTYKNLLRDGQTDWSSKFTSCSKIAATSIKNYNKQVNELVK